MPEKERAYAIIRHAHADIQAAHEKATLSLAPEFVIACRGKVITGQASLTCSFHIDNIFMPFFFTPSNSKDVMHKPIIRLQAYSLVTPI